MATSGVTCTQCAEPYKTGIGLPGYDTDHDVARAEALRAQYGDDKRSSRLISFELEHHEPLDRPEGLRRPHSVVQFLGRNSA